MFQVHKGYLSSVLTNRLFMCLFYFIGRKADFAWSRDHYRLQTMLREGLCLGGLCSREGHSGGVCQGGSLSGGSLSMGISVYEDLCPGGVSVQGVGLCPEGGSLCPGVSVQGVSV